MKNKWIVDSGASFHITNNDTSKFNVFDIDESIQGNFDIMPAMKKGKLWVLVQWVDGTEWAHTLWSMKFCLKAGANLFFLMCKLLQGNLHKKNVNNLHVDLGHPSESITHAIAKALGI